MRLLLSISFILSCSLDVLLSQTERNKTISKRLLMNISKKFLLRITLLSFTYLNSYFQVRIKAWKPENCHCRIYKNLNSSNDNSFATRDHHHYKEPSLESLSRKWCSHCSKNRHKLIAFIWWTGIITGSATCICNHFYFSILFYIS